ncbi:hypothetical protein ScPMuIL_008043 [Solemya velum]
MEDFDVNISIPPADHHSENVKVSGPPANVTRARAALVERCEQLEREKEDRLLKSFQLTVDVDAMYHLRSLVAAVPSSPRSDRTMK